MIYKGSERALKGALYLIGTKLKGHPVMVPCEAAFSLHNNHIELDDNAGLVVKLTLDRQGYFDLQVLRNLKETLYVSMPYGVARSFVGSPVTADQRVYPYCMLRND
jgi:hypothetical protein